MGVKGDLGRRVELVVMDQYFEDISIGLYQRGGKEGPEYCVHTYSRKNGARERMEFVARAMQVLGGMESPAGQPLHVRFTCREEHLLACRRVFLEACKLDPTEPLKSRPLTIYDKKLQKEIYVTALQNGAYQVNTDGNEASDSKRLASTAGGFAKLGQMLVDEKNVNQIRFSCGQNHNAMIGLLLARALNVRSAMREAEMATSQGILASPSQQK